jgi:serine/threonine protein kinase
MVITVAIHLASALDAIHKQGKVLGGIFPDQILFGENGTVQLLELSASRLADDLTLSYLSFISPEQIEGKPPTIQSDIYSFGIVLYVFSFGRVPFLSPKREEVMENILQSKLVTFPRFPAGLSQLDWIIRKCLLRVPHRRFNSVEEVSFELRKVARPLRKLRELRNQLFPVHPLQF